MTMAGMGPPPKPDDQRRRRNATVATTKLPAEGRKGPPPRWPLIPDVVMSARRDLAAAKVEHLEYEMSEGKPVERRLDGARERLEILNRQLAEQKALEASLWRELWGLPQAAQWERLGWTRDVAQYVRHKVLAELGDLDSAREARQWSDRLGLSPMAMLRLRWEVVTDQVAQQREAKAAEPKPSPRQRLRVVDPGAVAGA
jgi:hypothetical protein